MANSNSCLILYENETREGEIIHSTKDKHYVHFTGFDRRLDCWVPADSVTLKTPQQESPQELTPFQLNEIDREKATKIRNIEEIYFSNYKINTWYYSPYPEAQKQTLFICEWCLSYHCDSNSYLEHLKTCLNHQPRGIVVYDDQKVRIYQIDGKFDKLFCQNLCLLGKLFVDHKTIFFDVEPFLFYVLAINNGNNSYSIVGYFSKVFIFNLGKGFV